MVLRGAQGVCKEGSGARDLNLVGGRARASVNGDGKLVSVSPWSFVKCEREGGVSEAGRRLMASGGGRADTWAA